MPPAPCRPDYDLAAADAAQLAGCERHVGAIGPDDRQVLANRIVGRGDCARFEPKAFDERNRHARSLSEPVDHRGHRDVFLRVGQNDPVDDFKSLE